MGIKFEDENAGGDVQVAFWKPGMQKHKVLPERDPNSPNFQSWIEHEILIAPPGLIWFLLTVTTDVFADG